MIVTLSAMKLHLGITDPYDDSLITGKIEAAQDHIERLLGFKIELTFGGVDQDPVPPSLKEAVKQLAAHWFENREATVMGSSMNEVPFSVSEIVREFRGWSF